MSAGPGREVGPLGRIGLGTPQANPTVEAEFAILLPRACSLQVTRLRSRADDPETRLREYLQKLDLSLDAYDTLRPEVFGFACTGSSYLLGAEEEARIVARESRRHGYTVETAARAIVWGLQRLGARRIALIAPYPEALIDAACGYWAGAGFEVTHWQRIATAGADTRGIYELDSTQVSAALERVPREGIDAVLVSGTGMPSLAALAQPGAGPPVVSSNSCLAARLIDLLGRPEWLEPERPAVRGWRQRYAESLALTPPA